MIKTNGGMIVGGSNLWGADTTFIGSSSKPDKTPLMWGLVGTDLMWNPVDTTLMWSQ